MSFGTNQTSLLDFLKHFKGNARAFGIVDHETITLKELKELDEAGMKGVRINYPQYDAIGNLEKQIELIKKQAECIKQVGWSLQIQDNNPEFWEKVSHFTPPKPKPILGVLFDRVTDQVASFINLSSSLYSTNSLFPSSPIITPTSKVIPGSPPQTALPSTH
jgi:hypothetical protein